MVSTDLQVERASRVSFVGSRLTTSFLNLSPEEKKAVAGRLLDRYSYDGIFAKHEAVLREEAK